MLRKLTQWVWQLLGGGQSNIRFNHQVKYIQPQVLTPEQRAFFATYHRHTPFPLTDEQQLAVIHEQPSLLLVAAAGSGKTATIIAKIAYLIYEGVPPEAVICLAYNTDAAAELNQRIRQMYKAMSFTVPYVKASTFHAFSLDIIAHVTQQKPSISPLATSPKALSEWMQNTIERLKATTPSFAKHLHQYLFFYANESCPMGTFNTKREYDDYMRQLHATRQYCASTEQYEWCLQALNGQYVASLEERQIINWLIIQGVQFEYEKPYSVDTTTRQHRQYTPDFYYPEAQLWHEHFALDRAGKAPSFLSNQHETYEMGVEWKRDTHTQHKTKLIETYSYQFAEEDIYHELAKHLKAHGVTFHPLTSAEVDALVAQAFDPDRDLAIFTQYLQHVKTNNISMAVLRKQLNKSKNKRASLFLKLFEPIYTAYTEHLQQTNTVDFDDLLYQGAALISQDDTLPRIQYMLVDEAQDISQARANIVDACVNRYDTRLFAVGDDWQSIYRFSGADIRFMTHFHQRFKHTGYAALTRTFRSNQNIVDVASAFIQKNPAQLKKDVHAHTRTDKQAVLLSDYSRYDETTRLLQFLQGCAVRAKQAQTRRSVFILTRYNSQLPDYINRLNATFPTLDIQCASIHRSKGLEADYVIVHHVNAGAMGFPAQKEEDMLLRDVMPPAEPYPHAEERRLLYVAITRARHAVLILYRADIPSAFITELAEYEGVYPFKTSFLGLQAQDCPKCQLGQLEIKKGPYGLFYKCSNTTLCTFTQSVACPACAEGKLVRKKNHQDKYFYACSTYPKCHYVHNK